MKSLFRIIVSALLAITPTLRLSAGGPTVTFDHMVHDFGTVSMKDGPLSCTFTLTNVSSEDIIIYEVVSSCGCTDVKWPRTAIPSGGTAKISATYKNQDGPYPFDKMLTAYITGMDHPVILRLRGVVKKK